MSKKEIETINSLAEFLAWRGFGADEPYYWARCFYKYTDCGPWAVFIMADEPARTDKWTFSVARNKRGKLQALPTHGPLPPPDVIRRFGFDAEGLQLREDREYLSSMVTYAKALGAYRDRLSKTEDLTFNFWPGPSNPLPGERKHILIGITKPVKATEREIYYEDIGNEADDGSKIEVDPAKCIGIKFGSIVEGSEAYSGPFSHYFPFETEDFERDEKWMEEETSYFWTRDNSQWYQLCVGDKVYFLHNTWGEIKWDGPKPSYRIWKKVEAFIKEHGDEIAHEPAVYGRYLGSIGKNQEAWRPTKIPGTRAEIQETYNDTTF